MEVAEAREALATVGLSPIRIEPVLGGWANFTFELDGSWMVRFPSNEGVAESTRRELRLLPELERTVASRSPPPSRRGRGEVGRSSPTASWMAGRCGHPMTPRQRAVAWPTCCGNFIRSR